VTDLKFAYSRYYVPSNIFETEYTHLYKARILLVIGSC
jgi:hypothetical protein